MSFSAFQILVNEGLVNLLTDELTSYLTTMNFEHNYIDHTDILSDAIEKFKGIKKDQKPDTDSQACESGTCNAEGKVSLFARRKGPLSCKNEDELKVVIERDNMIVGFVDAVDSDATGDSESDDETPPLTRKCLKRARSNSPKPIKKVSIKQFYFYFASYKKIIRLYLLEISTNQNGQQGLVCWSLLGAKKSRMAYNSSTIRVSRFHESRQRRSWPIISIFGWLSVWF